MNRSVPGRSILWLSILPQALTLQAADLRIDHVTVAGRDLHKLERAIEGVGLRSEYGGQHANHATEMSIASFADGSYIELIAIQPSADPAAVRQHAWSRFLESDAGPCAWAIRSSGVDAEVQRLRSAGIEVKPPNHSGRTRPDGHRLDWETAQVGLDGNGTFFPFLIRDFTPREKRAFPSGRPSVSDYTGIARVVIAVRDLQSSVARYRKALDLPEAQRQSDTELGAELAWFSNTPVILAAPLNSRSWLAQRVNAFGEAPCAFVLGRRGAGKHDGARTSVWFGRTITWFDQEKLGWRLGVE